nr:DUF6101 family protein [uncultured Cohaesibacter sp.]
MRRPDNHKYTEAISYQVEGSTRIDPHNLKKYFQSSEIRQKAAKLTGLSETILFGESCSGMVQIKGEHVLVECALTSGLPLIVRVPMGYYQGIGARFVVGNREGNPLVCILELVHKDTNLSVPVAVSTDLEDIAIDWQSWSRRYDLTMLHQPLGAGDYVPAEANGQALSGLEVAKYLPRRPHAQFCARRPRFLARRKTGLGGQMPALKGREIIARD